VLLGPPAPGLEHVSTWVRGGARRAGCRAGPVSRPSLAGQHHGMAVVAPLGQQLQGPGQVASRCRASEGCREPPQKSPNGRRPAAPSIDGQGREPIAELIGKKSCSAAPRPGPPPAARAERPGCTLKPVCCRPRAAATVFQGQARPCRRCAVLLRRPGTPSALAGPDPGWAQRCVPWVSWPSQRHWSGRRSGSSRSRLRARSPPRTVAERPGAWRASECSRSAGCLGHCQ